MPRFAQLLPRLCVENASLQGSRSRAAQSNHARLTVEGLEGKVLLAALAAGDANQDLKVDQFDIFEAIAAGKYLTGQPATWGEGDWDGAPGGMPSSPPAGDGLFTQLDIIAVHQNDLYLMGPYAAPGMPVTTAAPLLPGGVAGDSQTSVIYDAGSGEIAIDPPPPLSNQLTSINLDSLSGIFSGELPLKETPFDNATNTNIFKSAFFGQSFGFVSYGNVTQAGLSEQDVLNDLLVNGSLAGGGGLGPVDLIYISNVAPMVTVSGAETAVRGQPRPFVFTAFDPDADPESVFAYDVDWDGDGTIDESISGPNQISASHTFPAEGSFTITVTATDEAGDTSDPASQTVTVGIVALQGDDLVVGGTTGDDRIRFMLRSFHGHVIVRINGTHHGVFRPEGRLIAHGQDGNDVISVGPLVASPAWLFGDAGNDRLIGSRSADVLVGGEGNDLLFGGFGRDVLLGGNGLDRIIGSFGDDILVAGTTAYDANVVALRAIHDEWTSTRDYRKRVENIRGIGTGDSFDERLNGDFFLRSSGPTPTVFDDIHVDRLRGSYGLDWFFGNIAGDSVLDVVVDAKAREDVDDIGS